MAAEIHLAQPREELRRRFAGLGIHAKVEGTDALVTESPRRRVVLHRRHTQVRQDDVGAADSLHCQDLRQCREAVMPGDELVGTEALGAEPGFGARQLQRIDIQAKQPSAGLQRLENRPCMPAAAKRAIHGHLARTRAEMLQDLGNHDRPMNAGSPRGRLTARGRAPAMLIPDLPRT